MSSLSLTKFYNWGRSLKLPLYQNKCFLVMVSLYIAAIYISCFNTLFKRLSFFMYVRLLILNTILKISLEWVLGVFYYGTKDIFSIYSWFSSFLDAKVLDFKKLSISFIDTSLSCLYSQSSNMFFLMVELASWEYIKIGCFNAWLYKSILCHIIT